jgi:hypothetical protein
MSNQAEVARLVRKVDSEMAIPEHPEDESVAIMFGQAGFVASTPVGNLVLSTNDDMEALLSDPFLTIASNLYGHIMLVSYGMLASLDLENGSSDLYPARVIVAVTKDGFCASALRRLDTDETVIDDEGMVAGELRDVLVAIAKGE